MGRTVLITTPENVTLEYPLAGLGTRFLAVLVDTLLQGAILVSMLALLGAVSVAAELVFRDSSSWWIGGMILIAFLVLQGYFIVFESLWAGQTPGKRLLGLRVIREGGHPLDFRGAFLRNVVRVLDFLPALYGVGVLFVFFHPQCRRVGDLAAGTLVVRERELGEAPVSAWQHAADPDEGVLLPLSALTAGHLELASAFLRRRSQLAPHLRAELASEVAWRLRSALGQEPGGPASGWTSEQLIEAVVRRWAARAGL